MKDFLLNNCLHNLNELNQSYFQEITFLAKKEFFI